VATLAVVEDQGRIEPAGGKATLENRHQLRILAAADDTAAPVFARAACKMIVLVSWS